MARALSIFGAGTLARLARIAAEESGRFDVRRFVVDDEHVTEPAFEGLPVLRWSQLLSQSVGGEAVYCAVGYRSMDGRSNAFARLCDAGLEPVSLIDPGAHVSRHAVVGAGCFVMAGCVVEPGARLGANNIVWSNATLCHDVVIGDHNFIASGTVLGGHVRLGSGNFCGFGSIVRERTTVGNGCLLGARALLLQDAPDRGLYIGAPARRVRDLSTDLGTLLT